MTSTPQDRFISRRSALAGVSALGLALSSRGLMATAQEATPASTTFSTFGHPLVGTWQWTNYPGTSYQDNAYGTFTEGGSYVELSELVLVIGAWRATGERQAEVLMYPGEAISLQAAFEPQYVIAETCLVTREPELYRIMIEVDATGNRFTATGGSELQAGDNRIVPGTSYEGIGDRMTIASDKTATPES
jgi:hypothetical protein